MSNNKRALVAGGAGFIPSHLCDLLLAEGYHVTAVDSFVTGRPVNLTSALANGLELVEGDINQESTITCLARSRFDEIYSLASPASPIDFAKMPLFILETSSRGHRNLLELAREQKARILYASSSEVYGDAEVHPQPESYYGNVNTMGHRSCYDEAKRFGEALNYAYKLQYGLEVRTARIFNTYGPRMRPNDGRIIPNFFIQALQGQPLSIYGDGSQTRSFCYVSDQVRGLYQLMQSNESKPVNVGNPIERTVLEVAKAINDLTGNGQGNDQRNDQSLRYLPLPENDPKMRRPDITRARQSVGWEPKVSLESGLQECLSYFKAELAAAPGGIAAPTL